MVETKKKVNILNPEAKSNLNCKNLCKWVNDNNILPSSNSKGKTERQLAIWLKFQRVLFRNPKKYKKYIFYESNLKIVEDMGIPNIFKEGYADRRHVSNTHKVCRWIKVNKRVPKLKSESALERRYAKWLHNQRGFFKKGELNSTIVDVVKSYDLLDILHPKYGKEYHEKMCHAYCKFVKENNEYPTYYKVVSIEERRLYRWMQARYQAKKETGEGYFSQELIDIAKSYGLDNLF